jgi:hypothetical protein
MKERSIRVGLSLVAISLVIGAIVVGAWSNRGTDADSQAVATTQAQATAPLDIASVYNPVAEGDPLPDGFRQLLARDQIVPVYDPKYTSADNVDWPDGMLVLGVEGARTSKVYPITHLNQREMVIDDLDGLPILVSW